MGLMKLLCCRQEPIGKFLAVCARPDADKPIMKSNNEKKRILNSLTGLRKTFAAPGLIGIGGTEKNSVPGA
jgi:hypothetical protein